jgi:hypothetical protein
VMKRLSGVLSLRSYSASTRGFEYIQGMAQTQL